MRSRLRGGPGDHFRPGDWLVVCARSGFTCYASETVLEEKTGLRVKREFADKRNPQDFVRGVVDDQRVPFANPPGDPVFLGTNEVTKDSF